MPIFSSSSLGVGSITSLSFHPQNLTNDLPTNCSPFYPLYSYSSCTCNLLKWYRKSTNNRYPVQATQINASSGAKVDEIIDDYPVPPESPRPIRRPADWEAAKTYKENGSIYQGRIEGFNNGGLLVRFYSLVGFLPFPQLSPSHSCKEPNKTIQQIARGIIGSVMPMKVIEADEENKKLIFSEKEATWSNYSEKIKVGDVLEGRVGLVEDYGAFIHLRFPDGNYHLTGLVHVSEVSWDYVQDVRDVLSEGNEVKVKVTQVDR